MVSTTRWWWTGMTRAIWVHSPLVSRVSTRLDKILLGLQYLDTCHTRVQHQPFPFQDIPDVRCDVLRQKELLYICERAEKLQRWRGV
ncbi:hypothetical protein BGW80DRAFT_1348860 [Lactifluus volemus]|nr:hypothetical protein BGW80DRAFT_1348860 [Lactifluus volemus]